MHKGQASLEQLLTTGVALTFIAVIFYYSISMANDGVKVALAKDSVDKIANAIEHVHSLGPGSKETVNIQMPENTLSFNVSNNVVHMVISLSSGPSDVFQNVGPTIVGVLPQVSGPQTVEVAATVDGRVLVGGSVLSCSQSSITRTFNQGGNGSDSFSVTNVDTNTVTGITATLTGNNGDIVAIVQPPASLAAGSSGTVGITYTVSLSKTPGTYTGTVIVNETNSSECSVLVTVIVNSVSGPDLTGPTVNSVSFTPANPTPSSSIIVNATASDVATGNSTIQSCQEQIDGSGIWNSMTAVDGSYNQNTESISYAIGTLSTGTHSVGLRCTDSSSNTGNITTTNIVVGTGADITGPIASNITTIPASPTILSSITVTATGDDTATGGSNISMCQVAVDTGNYTNMSASDGAYGSISENVNLSIGTLSAGNHTVYVRCTDSLNNTGSPASYDFTVATVDTTGPIVTYLNITPVNPTTLTSITVLATGNDSTTGNSNISMCQLSVDGAVNWSNMTASDGAYDNISEDVNLSIGLLGGGSHNVSVRCIDSASNIGNTTNLTFSVTTIDTTGPIASLVATIPASPTTLSNITVTALGNDSATGGSNITMCQIAVDVGNYTNMSASDGLYNSVSENVNLSIGNLSAGSHNVSVRCIDSASNIGNTTNLTFSVTLADTTGPTITSITTSPTFKRINSTIVVNATGSDSGSGNSNISMCQISVDGAAYNNMTATGTSYNTSIVQNATYSIGTMSKGNHTVYVRCTDSAGNTGGNSSNTFTVYVKDMLFITSVTAPSAAETRWTTWMGTQTSNLGFSWSRDTTAISNITGGSVDIYDYAIVVMATAPASNAPYYSILNSYKASHYIVLLDSSMQNGMSNLGVATGAGSSTSRRAIRPQVAHYITTGYTIGTAYNVMSSNNAMWWHNAATITNVGALDNNILNAIINDGSNVVTYGPTRPDLFTADGSTFGRRSIDWALNNSING